MADLARLGRVFRARITQIMDLLMLAPEIQEKMLLGTDFPLRGFRIVVRHVAWIDQRTAWCTMCEVSPSECELSYGPSLADPRLGQPQES
jgi:hypothetical protein